MIIYGIKNCNTVKNALNWLNEREITFEFHDYKSKGISSEKLHQWIAQVGWEALVNKRGTTWRRLTDDEKETVIDAQSAVALMSEKTSVIKRPLIENDGKILLLGFDAAEYEESLG